MVTIRDDIQSLAFMSNTPTILCKLVGTHAWHGKCKQGNPCFVSLSCSFCTVFCSALWSVCRFTCWGTHLCLHTNSLSASDFLCLYLPLYLSVLKSAILSQNPSFLLKTAHFCHRATHGFRHTHTHKIAILMYIVYYHLLVMTEITGTTGWA